MDEHTAALWKDVDERGDLHDAIIQGDWLRIKEYADTGTFPASKNALSLAVKCKRFGMFKLLIEYGFSIDTTDDYGNTALHTLAATNNTVAMSHVLDKLYQDGIALGSIQTNKVGKLPLLIAVELGNVSMVSLLLTVFKPSNIPTKLHRPRISNNGRSELHIAIRIGNEEIISELLKPEHYVSDHFSASGESAIGLAVENGNQSILAGLLDTGRFDINAASPKNHSWTPLHIAARMNRLSGMDILLSANYSCRVDAQDKNGRTPMLCAVKAWHDNMRKKKTKHIKTIDDECNTLERLLKHGCDVNIRDASGHSAFDYLMEDLHFLSTLPIQTAVCQKVRAYEYQYIQNTIDKINELLKQGVDTTHVHGNPDMYTQKIQDIKAHRFASHALKKLDNHYRRRFLAFAGSQHDRLNQEVEPVCIRALPKDILRLVFTSGLIDP